MTWRIWPAPRGLLRCRASTWLLRRTAAVSCPSWAARGTVTTWTEPLIIDPEYWLSRPPGRSVPGFGAGQSGTGVSPPHGFGPAPEAFPLTIVSRSPSGVTATALGYQAVGMKPVTWRVSRSTTATAFSPESATYSVWP